MNTTILFITYLTTVTKIDQFKIKKLLNTMPSNEDNLAILKTKRKILIRLGCLEQAYVITEKC